MKENVRALLIDPDDGSREVIRLALTASGRVGIAEAGSYQTAASLVVGGNPPPGLVVINLDHDPEAALRLLRRAVEADPHRPVLPASARPESGLVLAAMRAGAREFLVLPPDPAELGEVLDRLLRPAGPPPKARRGPGLIAVTGAVGGVGCTTIAVNLAVGLARRPEDSILLADFDLLFGSADVALDLLPEFTLLEAAQKIDRIDEALLRRAVARHDSGVHILPRPIDIEDAAKIDPEALRRLLTVAKETFSSVVVDTSKALQSSDFIAFELADVILVMIQFDLFGLRNAARLLKLLRQFEGFGEKIKLVANRVGAFEAEISLKKAEATLGAPVAWQLPNATRQFRDAQCKGVPIVSDANRSKVQGMILEIAEALRPFPSARDERVRRGLFAGLFRPSRDPSAISGRSAGRGL